MNLKIFVFFLFLSQSVFGVSPMRDLFYISIDASNLHASIKINGFEAISHTEGFSMSANSPVDLWLAEKSNKVGIVVDTINKEQKIVGELIVEIFKHDPSSETPAVGTSYFRFVLSEQKDVVGSLYRYEKEYDVDIDHSIGSKLWSDAEVISEVSGKDKAEIAGLIVSLEKSILLGKADGVADILAYKVAEDARIEKKSYDKALELVKKEFSGLSASGDLGVHRPFSEDIMSLKRVAQGKVFHVKGLQESPALQLEIDDFEIFIEVYVAKIDGKWQIVR